MRNGIVRSLLAFFCFVHTGILYGNTAFNARVIWHDTSRLNAKTELFSSGFLDIINNGQVNASARLLRIYLGEPGRISLPVSVYSGVSSNNFQNQLNPANNRSNEQLAANLLNPLSGLLNISAEGLRLFRKHGIHLTKPGFVWHAGERLLTGYRTGPVTDPETGKPVNFLNTILYTGLYLQTGAWEKNSGGNMGICWFSVRALATFSRPAVFKLFTGRQTGFFTGWSAGWGVDITNLVHIKVVFYKYNHNSVTIFRDPVYQFSFQYAIR